ncbi:MAG: DUF4265 domain-containing protein [Arcicella sp.]|jgi:hypothetical protein|nr:DUF4265 domain-containing protein [Arcicella sp.]
MKHKRILFEHNNNPEDGFDVESAWAVPLGKNHYKLDNILFYAPEYSLGDIVSVDNKNGELFVTGLVSESGHSTVRIIFNNENDVDTTRVYLKSLGCDSEISDVPILISVDIPPNVTFSVVKKYLEEGEKLSKWSYEESCIAHND